MSIKVNGFGPKKTMIYNIAMINDSHMHSKVFSPDASQTPEEIISGASALSLPFITVTDHYDMDFPENPEEWVFDLKEYGKDIPLWNLKSNTNGGPVILMGIEIGWQSHLKDRIEETAASLPFDSVILAQHLFRGEDIYGCDLLNNLSRQERNKEYIGFMAKMCRQIDGYDIAAHYDYICRYVKDSDCKVYYRDCPQEFDDFFDALISQGKALEINTGTVLKLERKGIKDPMPDPEVIGRYLQMGGKLITMGSDAHTSDNIAVNFEKTAAFLKSSGVDDIYYYIGHDPRPDPEYRKLFR